MRRQVVMAMMAALVLVGQAQANDQLISQLKTLGKAVDDMSANISNAGSESDAQLLANVTRQGARQRAQAGPADDRHSGQSWLLPGDD